VWELLGHEGPTELLGPRCIEARHRVSANHFHMWMFPAKGGRTKAQLTFREQLGAPGTNESVKGGQVAAPESAHRMLADWLPPTGTDCTYINLKLCAI
jgi:hypothetical protein